MPIKFLGVVTQNSVGLYLLDWQNFNQTLGLTRNASVKSVLHVSSGLLSQEDSNEVIPKKYP